MIDERIIGVCAIDDVCAIWRKAGERRKHERGGRGRASLTNDRSRRAASRASTVGSRSTICPFAARARDSESSAQEQFSRCAVRIVAREKAVSAARHPRAGRVRRTS